MWRDRVLELLILLEHRAGVFSKSHTGVHFSVVSYSAGVCFLWRRLLAMPMPGGLSLLPLTAFFLSIALICFWSHLCSASLSPSSVVWHLLQERELCPPNCNTWSAAWEVRYFEGYGWYAEYLELRYRKARNLNVTRFWDSESRELAKLIDPFLLHGSLEQHHLSVSFRMVYLVRFSIKMIM